MAWQQIKINVKASDAEGVGDMLSQYEAQAVTFVDAKDTPMYEPKPGEILLWPDTQVIGLFDALDDLEPIVNAVKSHFPSSDNFVFVIDQLEDKDWIREWMENFHPMRFGKRLWICPSWRDIPDETAVNIMLDPGLAFGTGTHPTTSLCLQWLDSENLQDKVVVDFGCGSGILGIAALKLGAIKVIGIDIDPQALQSSRNNAIRNKVSDSLFLYMPEEQPTLQADIVIANILAAPLRDLSKVITEFCKEGGQLVMSGILSEQAMTVIDCYRNSFIFDPITSQGEWIRLSATKKKNMSSPKT